MEIAPYKVGFPLGLFFGLWGVILWVGYGMGLLTNYPSAYHANIMIGGFLFSFAGGFLMTAIPQFTGTKPASRLEVTALPVFLIGFICSVVINNLLASHLFLLGYLLFLVFFGATRFRRRKYAPPSSFVFVGIGLATGIFGMLFTTLDDVQGIASILGSVGRLMYLQGVMLCLVLGVGSRLAPALMGLTKKSLLKIKPSPEQMANRPDYPSISFMLGLALILISSFFVEGFWSVPVGRSLRALVVSFMILKFWRVYRMPSVKTKLSYGLWASSWLLILGFVGNALFPSMGVHLLHFSFIGGFGLMALTIASRVTLAHGNYDLAFEAKSKSMAFVTIFIGIAVITRVTAPFVSRAYKSHLTYAAIFWIAGLLLWGTVFLPKMFKISNSQHEQEC